MTPRRRATRLRMHTLALALLGAAAPGALARAAAATAPQGELRGQLRRAGDRAPLAGVAMLVYPAPEGARPGSTIDPPALDADPPWVHRVHTEDDGSFEVTALPVGRIAVEVWIPGYAHTRWIVDFKGGPARLRPFFLAPEDRSIYRTVVRDRRRSRPLAAPAPVERRLSREEIRTMPGSQGDPLRALQSLPGVARAPFGVGLLVLRGAGPRLSQVYVGDHPVPLAFHLSGFASILQADAIESLDFAPSNFAPAYGNASGGLIAITPRRGRRDRVRGHTSVDLGGASALVEGPAGKGAFLVAARRGYLDLPLRGYAALNPRAPIIYPNYYDAQAAYDRPLGRGREIHVGYLGSGDRLAFKSAEDVDGHRRSYFETRLSFHRFDLAYRARVGATSFLLTPAIRFDTNRLVSETSDSTLAPRRGVVTTLRAQVDHEVASGLTMVVGADAELARQTGPAHESSLSMFGFGDSFVYGSAGTSNTTSLSHAYLGLYGEVVLRRRGVMVAGGGRLSSYSVEGIRSFSVDPRLRASAEVGDRVTLSAGLGLYSQPWIGVITLGSYGLGGSTGHVVLPDQIRDNFDPTLLHGELGLRVIRALHATAGAAVRLDREVEIEAHGFVRDLRDPSWGPRRLIDGEVELSGESAGGLAYGGEFILRKRLVRNVYGWVAYTVMRALREVGAADPRALEVGAYDQRHNLVAVLSARIPREWQIGARFRLSSGLPYTPIVGAYGIGNDLYATLGEPYSETFPIFHQLDVRIDKRWILRRTMVSAYLDVLNVYNAANTEAFVYSVDFRQRVGGLSLPILPLFGVRVDL